MIIIIKNFYVKWTAQSSVEIPFRFLKFGFLFLIFIDQTQRHSLDKLETNTVEFNVLSSRAQNLVNFEKNGIEKSCNFDYSTFAMDSEQPKAKASLYKKNIATQIQYY